MSIFAKLAVMSALLVLSTATLAQDIRYSWFEISYAGQDVDKTGSFADLQIGQSVDISADDGNGVKFRGSLGTWRNFFAFVDFNSSDVDVSATITNVQGQFDATDEFDFTAVRGGVGLRWPWTSETDLYGAVSLDSTDFDFGSFAGENFDTDDKGVGASIGVRSMVREDVELRAQVRYTAVGDLDLTTGDFDSDVLFGVGFGYELIRGLSITGDFESGEFSNWNVGFRLDLDED